MRNPNPKYTIGHYRTTEESTRRWRLGDQGVSRARARPQDGGWAFSLSLPDG
jgi:hypothetical protein